MKHRCFYCIHSLKTTHEPPCSECFLIHGYPKFEEKKMEPRETDYSFNESIMHAIRCGKTVWMRIKGSTGYWFEMRAENQKEYLIGASYTYDWSLTKPVTIVKKQIERWVSDDCIQNIINAHEVSNTFNGLKTEKFKNKIVIHLEVEE